MASKETKARILQSALSLFNRYGSANVSTNRIAAECGISKGNLNYHYSSKREIILDIFSLMRDEINEDWTGDELVATINHMEFMFIRQLHMIQKYRFFYRELVHLLNDDATLQARYNDLRERRMAALRRFMMALCEKTYISLPDDTEEADRFITSTWVLSEHWMNYAESFGDEVDESVLRRGYDVLVSMMQPYFTEAGRHVFKCSREGMAAVH